MTAGLLMGRCIAGLDDEVEIVGVGIAEALSNRKLLIKTAKKLEKFIRKNLSDEDLKILADCNFSQKNSFIKYSGDYSEPVMVKQLKSCMS